jgi:hypothetical protein
VVYVIATALLDVTTFDVAPPLKFQALSGPLCKCSSRPLDVPKQWAAGPTCLAARARRPPPLVEYVQYVVVAQVKRSITDGEHSLRPNPFLSFLLGKNDAVKQKVIDG